MQKVIAIDIGGTKIAAAVVTKQGKILKLIKEPTVLSEGAKGLHRQVVRICLELKNEHPEVKAVGIGCPGPLHAIKGILIDPTNFGWKDKKAISFRDPLAKALKMPVVFDNDAVAAVLGEYWKAKKSDNCLVVTLGTGLGVGVVLDGRIYRGREGYHPEAGHMILRPEDKDIRCACGADGCAEGVLSGNSFAQWVGRKTGRHGLSAQQITEMAKQGDLEFQKYFDEYSVLMAQFIATLTTLYYSNEIVIAGSFAEAAPLYLEKTKSILKRYFKRRDDVMRTSPKVSVSKLNNKDGIFGAAYMAFNYKTYYKQA